MANELGGNMRANEVFVAFIRSCEEAKRFLRRGDLYANFEAAGTELTVSSRTTLVPWIAVGYNDEVMDCVYVGVNLRYNANAGDGLRLSQCLHRCFASNGFPVDEWCFSATHRVVPNRWPVWKEYTGLAAIQHGSPEAEALIRQMCDDVKSLEEAWGRCDCI